MLRNEDCISFLLGKAYQQVNQTARELLVPYGVTPVQFASLNLLWVNNDLSGAVLGERLQLDSATITGVIDRLEQMGLVERWADSDDRRVKHIHLTKAGMELQGPLTTVIEQLNNEFFGRFTRHESELLQVMLANIGQVKL